MRHLSRRRAARGLTLIELMIGLAIAAMLLMAGAPYYVDYVENARLHQAGNTLYAETMLAQSEAIKRNATLRVTVNGANIEMRDLSTGGSAGTLIRETAMAAPVTAVATTVFQFGSDGRPLNFSTVSVNLNMAGLTCSTDRRCPGLRVDAGGAVRLCSNYLSGCD